MRSTGRMPTGPTTRSVRTDISRSRPLAVCRHCLDGEVIVRVRVLGAISGAVLAIVGGFGHSTGHLTGPPKRSRRAGLPAFAVRRRGRHARARPRRRTARGSAPDRAAARHLLLAAYLERLGAGIAERTPGNPFRPAGLRTDGPCAGRRLRNRPLRRIHEADARSLRHRALCPRRQFVRRLDRMKENGTSPNPDASIAWCWWIPPVTGSIRSRCRSVFASRKFRS